MSLKIVKPVTNPLDLPGIVGKIVGNIESIEDLKNIRTLGHIWLKETFTKWRNSAVFLINYETIPVLVKAFGKSGDLFTLTESQKAEALAMKDPLKLQKVPFKRYRFAKSQTWMYPLDEQGDFERKLIWEKCINPNATYVDLGECIFKYFDAPRYTSYLKGLEWILSHSSKVTELALAPLLIPVDGCIGYVVGTYSGFKAPKVTSLFISAPLNKLGPSFFSKVEGHRQEEIFLMLPNLKSLKLATDDEATPNILHGVDFAAYNGNGYVLESIDILGIEKGAKFYRSSFLNYIFGYLSRENLLLHELKLPFLLSTLIGEFATGHSWPADDLINVRQTLTKLEFEVECNNYPKWGNRKEPMFSFGDCDYPNLAHLKVQLDYKAFFGNLPVFDFPDLKRMPSLQEFHFGNKTGIVKAWVTKKLDFMSENDAIARKRGKNNNEMTDLRDLRSFHFHGNFKKQALHQLARMTGNLESLEIVLDKENCSVVKNSWPDLKNLKLLPFSEVPEEFISNLMNSRQSLNFVDESKNWPTSYVEILDGSEIIEESE